MSEESEKNGRNTQRLQEIAGFQILSKIGKGGMGAVFKARQKSLDRVVALKILPPSIAKNKPVLIERFIREARASAALNHPNIVQGIDVGQDEGTGLYYFAMEFIDGPSVLRILKKEGPLEERRALEIVQGVAKALVCAHEAGIIHRDIKPDNILLTKRGETKLADLGLAKRLSDGEGEDSEGEEAEADSGQKENAALTLAGRTVGTPNYMAPEQVRGKNEDLDARADLYALGATFYHMLTGQPPFKGKDNQEIMRVRLHAKPPQVKELNPKISKATNELILKLMQLEPKHRLPSAAELDLQIERILNPNASKNTAALAASAKSGPRPGIRKTVLVGRTTRIQPRRAAGSLGWAGGGVLLLALAGAALLLVRGGGGSPRVPKPDASHIGTEPVAAQLNEAGSSKGVQPEPVKGEQGSPRERFQALLESAREVWKEPVAQLRLASAQHALEDFLGEREVPEAQQEALGKALCKDLTARLKELGKQVQGLRKEGQMAEALELYASADLEECAEELQEAVRPVLKARGEIEAALAAVRKREEEAEGHYRVASREDFLRKRDVLLLQVAFYLASQMPGAAEVLLDRAAQRPELREYRGELARIRETLKWPQAVQQAVEAGAAKLRDGRNFTLGLSNGKELPVGGGQPYTVMGVSEGRIQVKLEGAPPSIVEIAKLSPLTQHLLAHLGAGSGPGDAAAMRVRLAFLEIVALKGEARKGSFSAETLRQQVAEAEKDGAPKPILEALAPWMDQLGRWAPGKTGRAQPSEGTAGTLGRPR